MKGPWTAVVVINFIFFLDIIRVLMVRVKDNRRHAGRSQYRKFGKFILVLIPLFGIMYIVLNVAFPSEVNAEGYNVLYLYVEMGYNSFQGFVLALLFCFLNEEVHSELRRSWHQQRSRRYNSKMIKQSWVKQGSRSSAHASSLGQGLAAEGGTKVQVQGLDPLARNGHAGRRSRTFHCGRDMAGITHSAADQNGLCLATSPPGNRSRSSSVRMKSSSPQATVAPAVRQHFVVITGKIDV